MRAQNQTGTIKSGENMKIKIKICIIGLMLAGFCALDAAKLSEKGIKFEKFIEPTVNGSLYLDMNGQASIDIAILVNEQGEIDDWIPLRTNDKLLINSIGNVIDKWRLKPAMFEGKPSWCYTELHVEFMQTGAVVNIGIQEAVISMFHTMHDDFALVVPFSDLDSIPKPIVMETPTLSSNLFSNNIGRTVKFEFFIDEDGNVRMPIVKESSAERMATAIILDSLLKWKFEAPTKNGTRVATRAIIPFDVK
jgi:hypothetical protein